jgi:gliding motility-associated-like protein
MYYHSTTAKYGIDAARDAFSLGIPQLVINNAQENSDVSAALYAQGVYAISGSGAAVWLGITDSSTTYTWRTIATGGSVSYFNWAAGDPNNLPPSCKVGGSCLFCTGADAYWCAYGEDCAVMEASGQWEDNSCQGSGVKRVVVLELNTCPVITRPRDTAVCSGSAVNLSTSVISGGTAPYTYTWNPGALSGPSVTITPTSTQTYTVEASDHYSCKTDSSFTVTVHTATPPAIIVAQPTICKGVNDNISLSSVSGTATYTWSFGTGSTIVSGSGSGPYSVNWSTIGTKSISVTVSDIGCTSNVTQAVTVDSTSAAFTLSPVSTCIGGHVTATVTNPSATATYTWNFGTGTVVSGSGAGPYTITWATTGPQTVNLTVTDNGCTATSSQSVTITAGLTPSFTVTPASPCQGQVANITYNGIPSGTATYTWTFDNAVILSGATSGPYSIRWDTAGIKNASLTVTDGGCTGSYTQPVNVNPLPTADAGPDIQLCPGVAGTLGSTAIPTDTYSWSPAWGLSSTTVSNPTITIPSNPTGSIIDTFYVVTVTSVSGCSSTDTVNVTIYPDVNSSFTINPATACQNSNITVTYSGTFSATATYTWNFGSATVISGSGAGPYTISYPATGPQSISLTVTDNGCTSNSTNPLTVSNSLSPAFTLNPSSTTCAGQAISVTLTGTPSGTATYTWDFNGANIISGSGAGPYSISWNTNGIQIADLTVTDGGCTGTAADSITIANTATADAGPDIRLCPGVTGTLGSPSVSGDTYSWSPTAGLSDPTIANPTITIPSNPTGSIIITPYAVTVTSGACSASDTALITIYPDIDNNFTLSSTGVCTGDYVTVTYSGTPSGTASYNWNFGGAAVVSGSGAGPYTISWTTPGTQAVTLSITDNGCTATPVSQTVAVGLKPTANAGSDQTICSGDSVQLGAAPVPGVTYTWTPATHLSNSNIADPYFAEINTGTTLDIIGYMLIANGGGCPDTAYVTITANPVSPTAIVTSGPTSFCQGDSVILQDGSAPQADYLWSDAETTPAITVKTSGTYSLTAHDVNGCMYISSPSVTVTVNPLPSISLAPNGELDESCTNKNDGSLSVSINSGTQPYTFSWNTTPVQNGATATNLAPGTYTVSVSDANGCTDTNSFTVSAAPFIGVNIDSMRDVSCYKKSDGAIYAGAIGGNLPVSYLWSTGAVTPAITNLSADTFTVSITDARGCTVDTSVIITQPAPFTFTTVSSLLIDYGGQQEIDITVDPANSAYTYAWSPGATLSCTVCPNPVASPLQTMTYILTVTDPVGGCSATDTIILNVDPSKKFYIPNAFTPNNDGVNDVYQVFASGPVKYFEMLIFDRWGEKVYNSNDLGEGWDGRYRGVFVSNGDYVYHATITFLDGQTLYSKGTVTVLK